MAVIHPSIRKKDMIQTRREELNQKLFMRPNGRLFC